MEKGNFLGFNVGAGLATFADVKTRDAFCDFEEKWQREFGDGTYPAYFNFDSQGAICELFVAFIDATLSDEE